MGLQAGDYVLLPDATFAASAFAVSYLGAIPYFIDVDYEYSNIDTRLLEDAAGILRADGGRIGAIMPVDLYGTPADYASLTAVSEELNIPVLEDAAESLGSTVGSKRTGSFGEVAILSFNGNKILTTSGGGMLLTDDEGFADSVRRWATQAREPTAWYEHREIGYNYRLSNLLAALGVSQMKRIEAIVEQRRNVREWYQSRLSDVPGVSVLRDPPWGKSNSWLTVAMFDKAMYGEASEKVRLALEKCNIESRPVWKPMHQQPVYADAPCLLTGASSKWFTEGLCLPSGPSMTLESVERVCSVVTRVLGY